MNPDGVENNYESGWIIVAHIPTHDTRCLGDISFHAALDAANRPADDYDAAKWVFVPNTYTEYRYILGTRGNKPLICIGVNPSTAAPEHLDPTLQSVERIAKHNGYDSFIMLNVYAQRATSPKQMDEACHAEMHRENLEAFRYALSLSKEPSVWAAWGTIIEMRPYLADMIAVSMDYQATWYHCGRISKKGHPHHPLYLKKDELLTTFDVMAYLEKMKGEALR